MGVPLKSIDASCEKCGNRKLLVQGRSDTWFEHDFEQKNSGVLVAHVEWFKHGRETIENTLTEIRKYCPTADIMYNGKELCLTVGGIVINME
jgi:uncharacterized protein YbgA (DUF1722 family)